MANPFSKIYAAFAVPEDYIGPWQRDFHRMVARKYLEGMSGGHTSVAPGRAIPDLVREQLSIDWQVRHGCAPTHTHFMPEVGRWDLRPSVLRDRWASFVAALKRRYHAAFDPNPYRET